jgi:superfamily II DNA or RNA helicase
MCGQIFISTYSFLKTHVNYNSREGIKTLDEWLVRKPWGLVIFDECQTLPA